MTSEELDLLATELASELDAEQAARAASRSGAAPLAAQLAALAAIRAQLASLVPARNPGLVRMYLDSAAEDLYRAVFYLTHHENC